MQCCADGLAQAQRAGALHGQASCLGYGGNGPVAGRIAEAGEHLREALELATRIGDPLGLLDCLDNGGQLCAATHRWAEAVTVWAAQDALTQGTASSICRRTRPAARHPCGRPRRHWGPPGPGQPNSAARR